MGIDLGFDDITAGQTVPNEEAQERGQALSQPGSRWSEVGMHWSIFGSDGRQVAALSSCAPQEPIRSLAPMSISAKGIRYTSRSMGAAVVANDVCQ